MSGNLATQASERRLPEDEPQSARRVSEWATIRPEPYLYASQNPVCADIVARVALRSEGGWDAI
jgi:hypothetical protein